MPDSEYQNAPRLYVNQPLGQDRLAFLPADQTHYLKNVMRKTAGDRMRLFNGKDGEWIYVIENISKKETVAAPGGQIKAQPEKPPMLALIFAPLKKSQTDMVIEKATEIGVTDFYPVMTAHTNSGKMREDRWLAHVIEAAEQCERLTLPVIHPLQPMKKMLQGFAGQGLVYGAIERLQNNQKPVINNKIPMALLIGPEGGFSSAETSWLKEQDYIIPVSLGPNILRAETAAIAGLGILALRDYF